MGHQKSEQQECKTVHFAWSRFGKIQGPRNTVYLRPKRWKDLKAWIKFVDHGDHFIWSEPNNALFWILFCVENGLTSDMKPMFWGDPCSFVIRSLDLNDVNVNCLMWFKLLRITDTYSLGKICFYASCLVNVNAASQFIHFRGIGLQPQTFLMMGNAVPLGPAFKRHL